MDIQREIEKEFHGRFRLRWSNRHEEYYLEQKAMRGSALLTPPTWEDQAEGIQMWDSEDENYIRLRDGYVKVMTIRSGDRMPCPNTGCPTTVRVPIMETRQTSCPTCGTRYVAAFYPLNHILIEHIKQIDPERDGPHRVKARLRDAQLRREARKQKDAIDEAEMRLMDDKNQAFQKPMVGYGEKTAQRGDSDPYARFR